MGTICVSNYANLYRAFLKEMFIFNSEKKQYFTNLLKYYRQIDDIFCVFQGEKQDLNDLVDLINDFKDNLKFTCEFSREKIHFLDVRVMI